MSGPKQWVAKIHRKTSSRSNLSGSPLDDRTISTPPMAIVDVWSGSTASPTQRSSESALGEPPTECSNSSLDSGSTWLTQSPSTTPPKKTWEKNYKSFLKKSGKHPPKVPLAPLVHRTNRLIPHSSSPVLSSFLPLGRDRAHSQTSVVVHRSGTNLVDGFDEQSQHNAQAVGSTTSINHLSSADDSNHTQFSGPHSPAKNKDSSLRGGAFFKRLQHKRTTSEGTLDVTLRKGVYRKNSPTTTPPGSAASTPTQKRVPSVQEGIDTAADLHNLLVPISISSFPLAGEHAQISSSQGDNNDDNDLDHARHHGLGPPSSLLPPTFSRVQSMSSTPIIHEGKPSVAIKKDDEGLIRERKKAFTDFHNTGVDSSSAYLGDESSLHRNSFFLSSMAYPVGSAGVTGNSRHTYTGSNSFDAKKVGVSPSTSMGSISETSPQTTITDAHISPERSLRSLKGPEHWTKGERHAIIPAVLCMCPIQVLNSIMSTDDGVSRRPSLQSPQHGFGIGSIISDVDGGDSNGWFFADQYQPIVAGGGSLPVSITGGSFRSSNGLPSEFDKIVLGKATVAPLGMRSYLNEVYGWCTGVFILRQNYLFEYREGDSTNGVPWGFAHLPLAEAYPHKHFMNALHLDFFDRPCCKSGKRSLLLRVESKSERDRWVSLLHSASRMTIHDLYDVDESDGAPTFGQGRYATVRPARRKDRRRATSFSDTRYLHATKSQENFRNVTSTDTEGTMQEYQCALKIIDKKEFWSRVKKGRERADTLVREAAVQTTLAVLGNDTAGFIQLKNIFETSEQLVLELELLDGTDLFQYVSSRGILDETEAAHIMRDLLNCLNVLEKIGIAHRDVKPANLLMCHSENSDGTKVKLADFGMASFVGIDNLVRGRCGTPGFVAPEILLTGVNGGYGNKVDMFSAGVTLYVMLAGYEPFYGESEAELIIANREAKVDFPHADWERVSVEGRDLIEKMLVIDPSRRIGPSEALRHPWITRRAAN